MRGKENLPLPDEILLKILGYLKLVDLNDCAKVSKRFKAICMDRTLNYHLFLTAKSDLSLKDQKLVLNVLSRKADIASMRLSIRNLPEGQDRASVPVGTLKSLEPLELLVILEQKLGQEYSMKSLEFHS